MIIIDLIESALLLVFVAFFLKSFERTVTAPRIRGERKERRRIVLPRTPEKATVISKFLSTLTDEEILDMMEAKYPFWAYMTSSPYGSILPIGAAVLTGLVIGLARVANQYVLPPATGVNDAIVVFVLSVIWPLTFFGLALHLLRYVRIHKRYKQLTEAVGDKSAGSQGGEMKC